MCAGAALFHGSNVAASSKRVTKITPGPSTISDEEKTIAPDPAHGAEQGVILVEETELNQDIAAQDQVAYHLRAKILTNEGRDLANVEIPLEGRFGELLQWWGRTLLPDGTVVELPQKDLNEQIVRKSAYRETRVLKGALPAVVPGCVIDYGYVARASQSTQPVRVSLQRLWLVRELRYHWIPRPGFGSAYVMSLSEGLDLQATKEDRMIRVAGKNLPPVASEPLMPPDDEVRAAVTFYYTFYPKNPKQYWNDVARHVEENLRRFLTKDQPALSRTRYLKEAIGEMKIPADADIAAKLRTVNDWIGANVVNLSLRSSEEREAYAAEKHAPEEDSAFDVMSNRHGTNDQLDKLFVGFARELGAEAWLVLATDRTDHYFNPSMISVDQLDATLVAVLPPGNAKEAVTLVDSGSGLPYGEIPWWYTGSKALLLTPDGAKSITLRPSEAKNSVSETKATVRFEGDHTSDKIAWSRTATGQQWYLDRRWVRSMRPDARQKRLVEICGQQGDFEVSHAEVPDLDKHGGSFRISCEGSRPQEPPDETALDFKYSFSGAGIEVVPELSSKNRAYPVIFNFPRVDLNVIEVSSPEGFVPSEVPPPVKVEGRFGRYELTIARTPGGFNVSRKLALLALRVPASEYEDLRKFLTEVTRADRTQLSFRRAAEKP